MPLTGVEVHLREQLDFGPLRQSEQEQNSPPLAPLSPWGDDETEGKVSTGLII